MAKLSDSVYGYDMERRSPYRYEATSVTGFIQQLAVAYIARGHYFYVIGRVPPHKCTTTVDAKLLARYEVDLSRWSRLRRRHMGAASVHYLRHWRFFVLIATSGEHRFFVEEPCIRDVRRYPLVYGGYSVSSRTSTVTRRRHASVRIERCEYKALLRYFERIALSYTSEGLGDLIRSLPYEPFAPVRRQLLTLLRRVNRVRTRSGLDTVPVSILRLKRRHVLVFERPAGELGQREHSPTSPTAAEVRSE